MPARRSESARYPALPGRSSRRAGSPRRSCPRAASASVSSIRPCNRGLSPARSQAYASTLPVQAPEINQRTFAFPGAARVLRELALLFGWQAGKYCLGAVGILGAAVPIEGLTQSDALRSAAGRHDCRRVIGSKRMGMKPCRKVYCRHGPGMAGSSACAGADSTIGTAARRAMARCWKWGIEKLLGNESDGMLPESVCPGYRPGKPPAPSVAGDFALAGHRRWPCKAKISSTD